MTRAGCSDAGVGAMHQCDALETRLLGSGVPAVRANRMGCLAYAGAAACLRDLEHPPSGAVLSASDRPSPPYSISSPSTPQQATAAAASQPVSRKAREKAKAQSRRLDMWRRAGLTKAKVRPPFWYSKGMNQAEGRHHS
jgi:hypothetical protein